MRSMRTFADARTVATTAMLVAVASVLGIVETAVLPPLPVPGVRIGLANIAVLIALVLLGRRAGLRVALLRVLIVALATGSLGGPAPLLALAGAVASWAVMATVMGRGDVSVIGLSVAGAAAHVVAQLVTAAIVTGAPAALAFGPLSIGLSLPCGLAVGHAAHVLLARLPLAQAAARV